MGRLTLVGLLAALPASLAGQRDSTAGLAGKAISSFNGRPLIGVLISVPAARRFSVTDSSGAFAIAGIPAGRQAIRVSYLGRETVEHQIKLRGGKTTRLEVLLDEEAVDLAPVVVEASSVRFERSLAGFYDRKQRGFGRFFTWEDIDRLHPYRLSSLLMMAGITVRCGVGECVPYTTRRGRFCPMQLFLDGLAMDREWLDALAPETVAGVEIYRHAIDVPIELAGGRYAPCGAVVVWTRM